MSAPRQNPRRRLHQLFGESIERGTSPPWCQPDVWLDGPPRSASSGQTYQGLTPFLLWAEAHKNGWTSAKWYTPKAAEKASGSKPDPSTIVQAGSTRLINLGTVEWDAPTIDGADPFAVDRVHHLLRYVGLNIEPGPDPGYEPGTNTVFLPPAEEMDSPEEHAATLLMLLGLWTCDERRLDRRTPDLEPAIGCMTAALLSAHLRLRGTPRTSVDWSDLHALGPDTIHQIATHATEAAQFVIEMSHPDFLAQLNALQDGESQPPTEVTPIEHVNSLGDCLVLSEDDLADEDETLDRSQPLVLSEDAAKVLTTFLGDFNDRAFMGRQNPPIAAWIAGGAGSGRNQLVDVLEALLRTGGTDLDGTSLLADGDTDLLAPIESVWGDSDLFALPCTLPPRVRVSHDRAIPTACLTALHERFGLSPVLWVARLEHQLLRSGDYDSFVDAFEAKSGRQWRGDANRNPEPNKEAIIHALGGATKGARRRVEHYRRTRRTASWKAFTTEAEWSLFHLQPGQTKPTVKPVENAEQRRILFVLDLASALVQDDKVARAWLRKVLSGLPSRFEPLSKVEYRPLWFLLAPNIALNELAGLLNWEKKVKRKQVAVDLSRSPVTDFADNGLLAKNPDACRPLYELYAQKRADFKWLACLDGPLGRGLEARKQIIQPFPFLPGTLSAAQAILDTLAGDPLALPLGSIIKKALDEQYFAPTDRIVALDVLLEPLSRLLDTESSSRPSGARIFIGTPAVAPAKRGAFPLETVLLTIRWMSRVRSLPMTPANLVRLMITRIDRPMADLEAEVIDSLGRLTQQGCIKPDGDNRYRWLRNL